MKTITYFAVLASALVLGACAADEPSEGSNADEINATRGRPEGEPVLGVDEGGTCGGIAGLQCRSGLKCQFEAAPPGAPPIADEAGTCVRIGPGEEGGFCGGIGGFECKPGLECKYETVHGPIADAGGKCVKKVGRAGDACGVRGTAPCGGFLKCIFPESAECGATDKPGSCFDPSVMACAADYDPVCGCDGETYSNACMALVSGASVRSHGPCAKP